MSPFYSPSGEWIAYTAYGGNYKIRLNGSSPQQICSQPWTICGGAMFGGVWEDDQHILFSGGYASPGLWRISTEGGQPQEVKRAPEGEI